MAMGRPTDYTPDLGSKILELMSEGLSLAAAAADCNVHRQRVYEWVEKYPDFADTVKIAMAKRQSFLEKRLLSADASPVVTSSIFALKNAGAADWRDKVDATIEHSGQVGVVFQTVYESAKKSEDDG
jgi:Bacteriophage Sf6, terminase small subunit-like